MPLYKYKAVKEGKEYEDTREAADKQALYKEVRAEGGSIVSTEEKKSKESVGGGFSFLNRVKSEDKITFAKNLAVMLEAGIALSRALSIMAKQTQNKELQKTLDALNGSITSGKSLSESMQRYPHIFSNLFIMMVRAGEESGKIVDALRIVADQMDRSNKLAKKIKGAMIYPTIVVCVMILLGIVLMVYMVPTLTETFIGLNIELPLPTRIIVAVSNAMRDNFLLMIVGIIGIVTGGIYFFRTPKGKRTADFITLHLPLITPIAKEANAARTTRTLSSLISSGVDIVEAISVTRNVIQNSYYKKVLEKAGEAIQKGEAMSAVFSEAKDLYPIYVGEMTAVGEETGELSKMLSNIADFYEDEVDQKTKDLSTVIEPILMILIGLGVGAFAIAMLLPTYSLVDAIGV